MTHSPDEPAPVPDVTDQDVHLKLLSARSAAVDLIREAEDLEARARETRRRARARLKHYENLLAEHAGQMSVLDMEGVL